MKHPRILIDEDRCSVIFEACGSAMIIVEENGTISMANEEFERLSGYSKDEVENKKIWNEFLVGNELIEIQERPGLKVMDVQDLQPFAETLFVDRESRAKIVYTNVRMLSATRRCIVSMVDITNLKNAEEEIQKLNAELTRVNFELIQEIDERKNIEKLLIHQTSYDSLTSLPNRDLLLDRIKQAFAYADRHGSMIALMLLDLDNFKKVNDAMGQMSGDILLKEVAKRLQKCIRQYDTIARVGGDEFVVFLNDMKDIHDIVKFNEKVRGLFRQSFEIRGQSIFVTTSMGVAVYPHHGTNAESLLKMADMAMCQAKKEGKNTSRFFSDSITPRGDEPAGMKERLRLALEREEFLTHYQPRVNAASGKITGMEALIRWQPQGAPLAFPEEFFPSLEESGLVVPVGEWLLDKVCRQNKAWQDAGIPPLRVAVNLSARQFRQDNLPEKVSEVLSASGLEPRYLEIDLTEQIIMEDIGESMNKLRKLKEIGITISVGNFGTGSFSMSDLSRLPIDELKIDRSFINGISSNPNDARVVSASITMGHNLGIMLVAEGVESKDQYDFLARHRCEEMQGYFFSRPLPSAEFERLVRLEQPQTVVFH
ncbi:MAG TPA: EAL domain-containing protein [Geobacteraceae bacterium]|nr:EAL domain-containing protein [Geobacteraceae bacterium]